MGASNLISTSGVYGEDRKLNAIGYGFRCFILGPQFEGTNIQHGCIDPVSEFPFLIRPKPQWVVLTSIRPYEMRHQCPVGSEALPGQHQ